MMIQKLQRETLNKIEYILAYEHYAVMAMEDLVRVKIKNKYKFKNTRIIIYT